MPGTRKLGRKTAHRMLMLRGLVTYLLENGKIETTLTRAKEVSALADQMITLGKKGTLAARREALAFITKETVVKKVFDQLAAAYEGKNGGYTQIFKTGFRRGDAAEMAIVRLIKEEAPVVEEIKAQLVQLTAPSQRHAHGVPLSVRNRVKRDRNTARRVLKLPCAQEYLGRVFFFRITHQILLEWYSCTSCI